MAEAETVMPGENASVTLREVTRDTVREICALKVAPEQERFVATNALSIAQAYFDRELAWFRAIYADDVPVGFVMLADNVAEQEYYLWRFMIDGRYQGRGYGRRAIELLLEYVRPRPGATALLTSCVPGDGSPCPFYQKLGFVYTGEEHDGELEMRLDLVPSGS
jgi:diamine N-acetyltransferase